MTVTVDAGVEMIHPSRPRLRIAALLLMGMPLAGCGNDSSPILGSPPANPAGYYTGTLVSSVSGVAVNVVALASDSGELRILDPASDAQYVARLSFPDDSVGPSLSAYAAPDSTFPDKSRVCTGSIAGKVQPGTSIKGSYACGGDRGTFSLLDDVEDSLQEPSDRFPVLGARGTIGPADLLFIALKSDGSLTGSDSSGCSYTGEIMVIDPFINISAMELQQHCGGHTLTLDGLASFGFAPDTTNQAVYLALSNSSHSLVGVLLYQ